MNSLSPIETDWPTAAGAVVPDPPELELEPQAARAKVPSNAGSASSARRMYLAIGGWFFDWISHMRVFTIGHGTRESSELVETLQQAGVGLLVDVRRFPGSRRNPQFNQGALSAALRDAGLRYRHGLELGDAEAASPARSGSPASGRPPFAATPHGWGSPDWQYALHEALAEPAPPCFMCAETDWGRCHRRLIADLLTARGVEVIHLLRPGQRERHRLSLQAEVRDGTLYLCGELVA